MMDGDFRGHPRHEMRLKVRNAIPLCDVHCCYYFMLRSCFVKLNHLQEKAIVVNECCVDSLNDPLSVVDKPFFILLVSGFTLDGINCTLSIH